MNIVLVGLRGSGKSKIGKKISKMLKMKLIEVDDEIEKQEGMSIKKIIELKDWEYFRAVEDKIAISISENDNCVISTGGGTIINPENKKALKKNGKIIYLYRQPKVCAQYIENDPKRPALTNEETLEEELDELYKQRNQIYCKSSNLIFHRTDDLDVDSKELINQLKEKWTQIS
jgi:shikimate kinase